MVAEDLRASFGAWAKRFHYVVLCDSSRDSGIWVTITPANGQTGRNDPDQMRTTTEAMIAAMLERKQWSDRYTTVRFQFIP